jgi:NADH:ubiquinone oxidoreductase subunit F (NADH-binding)
MEPSSITVAAWPDCPARLLGDRPGDGREGYPAYRQLGGYQPLANPGALLDEVERSGLQGRGGAAFPLGVKLRTVLDNGRAFGGSAVVANGEEGEPASIKDRWLLRNRPHLVLDGLRLAAAMVAARRAYVYLADAQSAHSIEAALAEHPIDGVAIELFSVATGYVAGEETAATRAINGGPAKPTDKPPRPFEIGVGGRPTLVSNVETLANLPYLQREGAEVFRSRGTATSPGTFLATLTGAGRVPVLCEIPLGLPLRELLAQHGVLPETVRGALVGGYFAGLLNRVVLDVTLDHETLRGLGSGLGCGAIAVITDECPVAVAASVLAYFDRENAGQCGSCFNGTAAMGAVAGALRDGTATAEDVDRLRRWSVQLRGRGACATLDAATNMAGSLLDQFPTEVARHLDNACQTCDARAFHAHRPFEVEAVVPA